MGKRIKNLLIIDDNEVFDLFIAIVSLSACEPDSPVLTTRSNNLPQASQGYPINHTYYSLFYVATHRQYEFAFYYLTPKSINGGQKRTGDFRIDPKVKSNPVSSTAYARIGYDRGHLCPAADMSLNLTAMSETLYMSNLSPITPFV